MKTNVRTTGQGFVVGFFLGDKLVKVLTQKGQHLFSTPLNQAGTDEFPIRLVRFNQVALVGIGSSLERRALTMNAFRTLTQEQGQ